MSLPSNTEEYWRENYEEVWRLFEERERDEDTFSNLCTSMLENEFLPLAYRVTCQFLIAYTSPNPTIELQKALDVVRVIKNMEESGAVSRTAWLRRSKDEIERAVQLCCGTPLLVKLSRKQELEHRKKEVSTVANGLIAINLQ